MTRLIRNRMGAICALVCSFSILAAAQDSSNQPVRGPFWSGTIRGPKNSEPLAMKGIAITLGAEENAYICFDADLMRMSMGWTGDFLDFGNTLTQIAWPPPPQVKGVATFSTKASPGWAKNGSFADPREKHQGPLPKDWSHYEGLFVNGNRVVLQYRVNGVNVLESPALSGTGGKAQFIRTIQFETAARDQALLVADGIEGASAEWNFTGDSRELGVSGGKKLFITGSGLPAGSRMALIEGGRLVLRLGAIKAQQPFHVALSSEATPGKPDTGIKDLRALTKGGPARWTENITTKGIVGTGNEPYVVDTITEPWPNPYNARTFFGGFDFYKDGTRAAICTFHGDVWVVSGIDDKLEKLTWKRYATGLFQPLGLKIVDGLVYVLGRDQITRLKDLNNDGEADSYENFNNDTVVTANYHEFSLDLHTDRQGNFYFAKGSPWEPEVTSPHQGCLMKVSKDGSKMEIFATGLRAPNGMTVGPKDQITVSDNQGHWMPASKLNWVEKGGFYGMTPAAHRPLQLTRDGTNFTANPSDPAERATHKFKAWGSPTAPQPSGYDEPFCWLPMNMDNSSGGQVWVTGKKWGPFEDKLLFMSYGKCTVFEVMPDKVGDVRQGAMVQFPFKLQSGVMRGRIGPKDGQVYLAGLKGWQTSATRDGGFYRVRYTGKPVHMPSMFHAFAGGIEIGFTSELDAKAATDPQNYSAERWNYKWTGAYGSPEFSVDNPEQKKHDRLSVEKVRLLSDKRTVLLEIPGMKPSDQLKVKLNLTAADQSPINHEIYATVHKLEGAKAP